MHFHKKKYKKNGVAMSIKIKNAIIIYKYIIIVFLFYDMYFSIYFRESFVFLFIIFRFFSFTFY